MKTMIGLNSLYSGSLLILWPHGGRESCSPTFPLRRKVLLEKIVRQGLTGSASFLAFSALFSCLSTLSPCYHFQDAWRRFIGCPHIGCCL